MGSIIKDIQEDKVAIKDQIGSQPSTTVDGIWGAIDTIVIDEIPIRIRERTAPITGNAPFIVGHPTYAKVGIIDPQPTVGTGNWNSYTVERVICPKNTYYEYFRDTRFKDTGNTDATWDTTNFKIDFGNSTTAQSLSIFYNSQTVYTAKLTATITGTPSLFLSADGGSNWESVTKDVTHTFSTTGNDLRWKGTGDSGDEIANLKIEFTI